MSIDSDEYWLRHLFQDVGDPEIRARQRATLEYGLKMMPEVREKVIAEGELKHARMMVRRVLRARGLALGAEDEARTDTCADLDILGHWVEQAATATSTAEALR